MSEQETKVETIDETIIKLKNNISRERQDFENCIARERRDFENRINKEEYTLEKLIKLQTINIIKMKIDIIRSSTSKLDNYSGLQYRHIIMCLDKITKILNGCMPALLPEM